MVRALVEDVRRQEQISQTGPALTVERVRADAHPSTPPCPQPPSHHKMIHTQTIMEQWISVNDLGRHRRNT